MNEMRLTFIFIEFVRALTQKHTTNTNQKTAAGIYIDWNAQHT